MQAAKLLYREILYRKTNFASSLFGRGPLPKPRSARLPRARIDIVSPRK